MSARLLRIQGVVQGVGFRPFVYRLAQANGLRGWVTNGGSGVEIHIQGSDEAINAFITELNQHHPPAAQISSIEIATVAAADYSTFVIRDSHLSISPSVPISPDLPICDECLAELSDPEDPRFLYPYINCTNCGPRFSVINALPYDRARTTMRGWPMDELCARQYNDADDRRFHAQPVACPECGPHYRLESASQMINGDHASISEAADLLRTGQIVAVKGIGGYHLSCDARNANAVNALRLRKFRREKPFAVMVATIDLARDIVQLSSEAEHLLRSAARPIVLAPARIHLPGVAPDNHELGVMLPYAPLHHMLFAAGAPDILVMTSANRSSEPIAYLDADARERLSGIADAFLMGERPIARRVDDSVARASAFGPAIIRRSRGYAPGAVATFPDVRPVLGVGADLKNSIALIVNGQAFISQHIGDLSQYDCLRAFHETIRDFISMYRVDPEVLVIAHDLHPEYASTFHALEMPARGHVAVQHHHAHINSALAEREAWNRRAVGISFDGTGYGEDGRIWGGEFFTGSIVEGWTRAIHLENALLIGGDSASRSPVQCAAGFIAQLDNSPNLLDAPFCFPRRYLASLQVAEKQMRTFETSSAGRLFDTVAALLGFTRDITFEGQAAIWLEELACTSTSTKPYPFPLTNGVLDYRPLLQAIIEDRLRRKGPAEIARRFHISVACALWMVAEELCATNSIDLVVMSGGVFQNELLLSEIALRAEASRLEVWTNRKVPPNDGGISLGQVAAAFFCGED